MKQTVTSKYEPKSKNVTWIDVSSGSPILKNFINGMWRPTGGGGSVGTSNPTEADTTKVWQVTPVLKGTKTEETVIVPEQTLENEQELEYNDKFVPGAQCIAVINGVEYRGEVVENKGEYFFAAEFGSFGYAPSIESFVFYSDGPNEVTAKLSIIEEVPDYDYNWAPGVKIPIPTAEDEGKILVVTETEGNTFTIVPEQSVPADDNTPLTDVDLTKFVVGNTVKLTITPEENDDGNDDTPVPGHLPDYSGPVEESEPATESEQGGSSGTLIPGTHKPVILEPTTSQIITITGVIEEHGEVVGVSFDNTVYNFIVVQRDNLLYTDAVYAFDSNVTIKLECLESNYEYQLQENSGGSGIKYNEIPLTPLREVLSGDDEYPLIQEEVSETYPGYNFDSVIIDLVNGVIPEILYTGNLEGSPMIINAYRMSEIKVFDIDRNIKMYSYAGYNGSYIHFVLSNDGSKLYYVEPETIGPVIPSNPLDSEQSQ